VPLKAYSVLSETDDHDSGHIFSMMVVVRITVVWKWNRKKRKRNRIWI